MTVPAVARRRWPRPLVAVDVAAFTVLESDCKLLLIRRGIPPQESTLALPGGFVRCGAVLPGHSGALHGDAEASSRGSGPLRAVDQGEDLEAAARRELLEETRVEATRLVEVKAFSAPFRDPRTRVISVAWLTIVRPEVAAFVRAGTDAAAVRWFPVRDLDKVTLAFDHNEIARACLERLQKDVDAGHHELARELVPRVFSMAELRAALDAVTGRRSDPGNFRRKFLRWVDDGVIVAAEGQRVTGKRPAGVWSYA
ncbi:MAG: NUDIX hydrolase [Deltaproteobacteria bacterium]|nr:NUDIX hydrolase [Deltaproteobacteria bacterium]